MCRCIHPVQLSVHKKALTHQCGTMTTWPRLLIAWLPQTGAVFVILKPLTATLTPVLTHPRVIYKCHLIKLQFPSLISPLIATTRLISGATWWKQKRGGGIKKRETNRLKSISSALCLALIQPVHSFISWVKVENKEGTNKQRDDGWGVQTD